MMEVKSLLSLAGVLPPLARLISDTEAGNGCPVFSNLPSDPEDESDDLFVTSTKPLFPVRRLALDPSKR